MPNSSSLQLAGLNPLALATSRIRYVFDVSASGVLTKTGGGTPADGDTVSNLAASLGSISLTQYATGSNPQLGTGINGNKYLSFDGSNDVLYVNSGSGLDWLHKGQASATLDLQATEIFVVADIAAGSPNRGLAGWLFGNSEHSSWRGIWLRYDDLTPGNRQLYGSIHNGTSDQPAATTRTATDAVAYNQPTMIGLRYNYDALNSLQLWSNGVLASTAAAMHNSHGSLAQDPFTIGGQMHFGAPLVGGCLKCKIYYLAVVQTTTGDVLTDSERTAIYAYLANRFGIPQQNPALTWDFNSAMTSLPASLVAASASYTCATVRNVVQGGSLVQLAANQFGTEQDIAAGVYKYVPELAGTNLATYSEGAAANWTVSNVVNGTTFFGRTNALAFVSNSLSRTAYKLVNVTSGTAYTVSVFVIMDDGLAPVVGTTNNTGDFVLAAANAIITTGLLTTYMGSGVYRVSGSLTSVVTVNANNGVIKYTTQSARGFRITAIQVETGTSATSYILTGASTATRAATLLKVPVAKMSGFQTAGCTLVADMIPVVETVAGACLRVDDGSTAQCIRIGTTAATASFTNAVSATAGGKSDTPSFVAGTRTKVGIAATAGKIMMAKDGAVTYQNYTNGAAPTGLTYLRFANSSDVGQSRVGHVAGKLFYKALDETQLKRETT